MTLIAAAFALLSIVNWTTAVLLARLARRRPHIRALTERAVLAAVIALLTTAYTVVVANSVSHALMDFETARNAVRVAVFALGVYPMWWLWSYYRDRF